MSSNPLINVGGQSYAVRYQRDGVYALVPLTGGPAVATVYQYHVPDARPRQTPAGYRTVYTLTPWPVHTPPPALQFGSLEAALRHVLRAREGAAV